MKLRTNWDVSPRERTNSLLRWSRNILIITGILLLSYVGFVMLDARVYQAEESRRFDQELKESRPSGGIDEPAPLRLAEPDRAVADSPRNTHRRAAALGRLEVSRIGLVVMVMEGIDERTLQRAVGHIPGTPLPGQKGNIGIAGHRDTFFRALRNIRKDDQITLTTLARSYRYQVNSLKIVTPEQTEVLNSTGDDILTLVTCYPFNFVGSAPKRFIVSARSLE